MWPLRDSFQNFWQASPSFLYGSCLPGDKNLWALDLQAWNFHSRVTEHFKMALPINLCPHEEGKLHAAGPCRPPVENFRSLNNSMECKIISYKNGKNNLSRKYIELFFSMLIEIWRGSLQTIFLHKKIICIVKKRKGMETRVAFQCSRKCVLVILFIQARSTYNCSRQILAFIYKHLFMHNLSTSTSSKTNESNIVPGYYSR